MATSHLHPAAMVWTMLGPLAGTPLYTRHSDSCEDEQAEGVSWPVAEF